MMTLDKSISREERQIKRITILDRATEHLPEILFSATVLVLVSIRVVEAYEAFLHMPGRDWNSSEWMINYSAGFVRRGLGGEAIARLMRMTGLGFFAVWATATTLAYLGLCCYTLRGILHLRGQALWRFGLFFNPALLLFPSESVDYGSFMRKDVIFICGTVFNILLAEYALRDSTTGPNARVRRIVLLLSVAGAISFLLALLHEGIFLFCWFPLNLVILGCTLSKLRFRRWAIALLLSLSLTPSLVAVAACVSAHGDEHTAQAICLSWHEFAIPTVCRPGDDNFPAAVDALSWTMQDEFSLFSSLDWRFGGFLAVFVIAVVVEITAIAVLVKDAKMSHLVMLCVFPFVIALPIFVIACDWGRFLFVLMTQSLLVMLSDKIGSAVSCSFPAAVHRGRVPFQPLMEQCFLSFRRAAERHPWLFCFVLAMLSIPATPFGFTILRTNPVIICGTFIRHFSQIVHP